MASLVLITGCSSPTQTQHTLTPNISQNMNEDLLKLTVTGYSQNTQIPAKFATRSGGGENVSIGLKWQPLPAAQSYALLFDDRHPVANHWVHWLVVDIPLDINEISEGASQSDMPVGSRELTNSWNEAGYGGPQPPVGSGNHEYVATLYALNIPKLSLEESATRDEFLKAIEPHVITQQSFSGFFERK